MRRSIHVAVALVALAGCRDSGTPPSPSSFDLPGDVSFGCVERPVGDSPAKFVALESCRVEDGAADPGTHSLVALVTQVATGEVAAVDLRENRSLDSNALVPGFTYQRVGEIPTGIVTIAPSGSVPSITFVSSFGSRMIEAIDTARFHPDAERTVGFVETRVDLPEGPTDIAFVPVTGGALLGYLFAPLPASGSVAQVPVSTTGALGAVTILAVDPDPLNALGPTAADEVGPYERICTDSSRDYAEATAPAPAAGAATGASPVKLEIDLDSTPPVLLVADDASPVIHRFAVSDAGATALQGFGVGVPTLDLAVTPPVTATVDAPPDTAQNRYLYAVDATDGSVLALDYTPTSTSFGAVLAVNVGPERPDRIALREPARALEVITPELRMATDGASDTPGLCDPTNPIPVDRAEEASPGALRGVFLTVGLENGLVAVIDVWDLEAPCRGGLDCQSPANGNDVEVAIRRHRPRIADFVTELPIVTGSPSLSFETNPGLLDDQGFPTSGSGPGLQVIDCGAVLPPSVQGFPDPTELQSSLICLRDDPWAGLNQRFTAVFDGAIPHANGADGILVDDGGTLRFQAPNGRFCEVGVLGASDVANSGLGANDPEVGYGGDQLEIVGDLPPDREDERTWPGCTAFDLPDDGSESDREPIVFQIVAAYEGELTLAPLGATADPSVLANVLACFPHPTAYRVRTRGAYVVASSGEPMRHRVVSAAGACRVDTVGFPVIVGDPDTYRSFRAIPGRTFVHPLVAFQITLAGEGRTDALAPGQESQLLFDVSRYPPKLAIDLGSVPIIASMRWSAIDDRLYVVDQGLFQVDQIDTDAFQILRAFD